MFNEVESIAGYFSKIDLDIVKCFIWPMLYSVASHDAKSFPALGETSHFSREGLRGRMG